MYINKYAANYVNQWRMFLCVFFMLNPFYSIDNDEYKCIHFRECTLFFHFNHSSSGSALSKIPSVSSDSWMVSITFLYMSSWKTTAINPPKNGLGKYT